jgi:hypothetical protein
MRESPAWPPVRRTLRHLKVRGRSMRRLAALARASLLPRCARGVELAMALVAYTMLPLWPLVAAAVARDASYALRYPATLPQVVRHIRGAVRGRSVSRYIVQKLAPHREEPQQVRGACTHCGNCCLYGGCVYLDFDAHGRSLCRIYGGRVWKMLSCGEYPTSAREIELYDCPSFSATPCAGAKPRVIPIVAARRPPLPEPARAASGSRARK